MKIAQVAPLIEAVPPKMYGGTERVVAYLTDALVSLGHDVTLFASGDSATRAKLAPIWPRALRLDTSVKDYFAPVFMQLEIVARRAREFDVIHAHLDYFGYPLLKRLGVPSVTTLHGRLDLPELPPLYGLYGDIPVVSISDSQREPLPEANYVATVPHGLPRDLLRRGPGDGGYLAFLGRISPEKAPDAAIRIAVASGMPLKIAAKVDRVDEQYFAATIEPLLSQRGIEYIGEISEGQKNTFLGQAAALLFPIDLAGAVRIGDDRGHGLRHAGDRLQQRFGSRSARGRRYRVHRGERAAGHRGGRPGRCAGPGAYPCRIRPPLHRAPHGPELSEAVLAALQNGADGNTALATRTRESLERRH